MSNLPRVDLTIQDGGLGIGLPLTGKSIAVIGASSAAVLANLTVRAFSNKTALVAARGYGPAVEAAANYIDRGALVIFVGTATTTPGTKTAVVEGAGGAGASVMTLTGNPVDAYDLIVTVTRSGTAGSDPEPGFKYSLDGGRTESAEIRVSGGLTYLMPNTGITLNFTAATMVAGDTYSASTTEPLASSGDVLLALDALSASPKEWRFVHIVGPTAASVAASIATKMDTMETATSRYVSALVEVKDLGVDIHDDWEDDIVADYNTFVSSRVVVAAGHARFPSALSGQLMRKSIAFPAGARAAEVEVHVDLGRVKDGPLKGVDSESLTHDERVTETLDSERFLTLRTFVDEIGAYVTNPKMRSAPGSDFKYWQHRFVMDIACRTSHKVLQREVNDNVRVVSNEALGYSIILEQDRQSIKSVNDDALRNALIAPGHASLATTDVAADDDILSTETVTVTIEIIPVGYKKRIAATIGFRKVTA